MSRVARCIFCGHTDRPLTLNWDGSATCQQCEAEYEDRRKEEKVAEVFCDEDDGETD